MSFSKNVNNDLNHELIEATDYPTSLDWASRLRVGAGRILAAATALTLLGGAAAVWHVAGPTETVGAAAAPKGDMATETKPDYTAPVIDQVGSYYVVGTAPGGINAFVNVSADGSPDPRCGLGGSAWTLALLRPDGTTVPTGLEPDTIRRTHPGPDGKVFVTSTCQDEIVVDGMLTVDGETTDFVESNKPQGLYWLAEPIWADDGSGFSITARPGRTVPASVDVRFDADGNYLGSDETDRVLINRLADGTPIEFRDGDYLIGDRSLTDDGRLEPIGHQTDDNERFDTVAVFGDRLVQIGPGPDRVVNLIDDPVLEATYSLAGDLAAISYNGTREVVTIKSLWNGGAETVEIDVIAQSGLEETAVHLENLAWIDDGRALAVSGTGADSDVTSWIVRFPEDGRTVQPGIGPDPAGDNDHDRDHDRDHDTARDPVTTTQAPTTAVPTTAAPTTAAPTTATPPTTAPPSSTTTTVHSGYPALGFARYDVDYDNNAIVLIEADGTSHEVLPIINSWYQNRLIANLRLEQEVAMVYSRVDHRAGIGQLVIHYGDFLYPEVVIKDWDLNSAWGEMLQVTTVEQTGNHLWIEWDYGYGRCHWIEAIDRQGNPVDDPSNRFPLEGDPNVECPSSEPILS